MAGSARTASEPLDAELLPQRPHVALRTDVVLRQDHVAVGTDNHGGPDRAFADLAVHQLLAPGAVREGHSVVFVREKGERERMFRGKGGQGLPGVG